MFENITLVIPTHNRQNYLYRILGYYAGLPLRIIVGDSSSLAITNISEKIEYYHLPGLTLPKKLGVLLQKVTTKFTVMCADDDFLIPNALAKCVAFLEANKDFSVAQGLIACFYKESLQSGRIKFSTIYKEGALENRETEPFSRLKKLFNPYHTFFYGVHYSQNLKDAFRENISFNNLFLNEYLTGIVPLYRGKSIELPFLYQLREYAFDSDDKKTTNLYDIINNAQYVPEYNSYLDYVSKILTENNGDDRTSVRESLAEIMNEFSWHLKSLSDASKRISLKKRLGNLLKHVPVVGPVIILKSREMEQKKLLASVVISMEDKQALKEIESFLTNYAAADQP